MSDEQEKMIMRTIEKVLHDRGLVVLSHEEGSDQVIVAEDSSTRTVTRIRISREKK